MSADHPDRPPLAPSGSYRHVAQWLLGGVLLIVAGWALRAMAPVVIPVVFAVFLTLMLRPLDRRVADALPGPLEWAGRVAVMLLLLVILGVFAAGLAFSAQQLLGRLPSIAEALAEMLPDAAAPAAGQASGETADAATATPGAGQGLSGDGTAQGDGAGGLAASARELLDRFGVSLQGLGQDFGSWALGMAGSVAEQVANTIGGLVAALIVVFFLVLLGLSEAPLWNRKIESLCARTGRAAWHDTLKVTASRLRRFLLVRVLMGVVSASLYVGWLALFGIDLLLVWAVLTFLLTFIPNLGSVISGTLPVLYALVTADLSTVLVVAAGLFVIEQVIGNLVDPLLQGRAIVLSPLVVLVALLLWGWLWGVAGALLAVPMTVTILIVCNHVPALRPIALFLSNQPDHDRLDEALAG